MTRFVEPRSSDFLKAEREVVARKLNPHEVELMDEVSRLGTAKYRIKTIGRGRVLRTNPKVLTATSLSERRLLSQELDNTNQTATYRLTKTGSLVLAAWHSTERERVDALLKLHKETD